MEILDASNGFEAEIFLSTESNVSNIFELNSKINLTKEESHHQYNIIRSYL